jgi:hypothetical protein
MVLTICAGKVASRVHVLLIPFAHFRTKATIHPTTVSSRREIVHNQVPFMDNLFYSTSKCSKGGMTIIVRSKQSFSLATLLN